MIVVEMITSAAAAAARASLIGAAARSAWLAIETMWGGAVKAAMVSSEAGAGRTALLEIVSARASEELAIPRSPRCARRFSRARLMRLEAVLGGMFRAAA